MQPQRPATLAVLLSLAGGLLGAAAWPPVPAQAGPWRLDQVDQGLPSAVVPIQLAPPGDNARFAQYEVRLGQLEEELRQLTGRLEQLEYGQRQVDGRIDQLIADLDQRLRALEVGKGQAADEAGPAPDQATAGALPADDAPPDEQSRAADALQSLAGPPEDAAPEGTLGRVPQSALTGLPRPDLNAIKVPDRSTLSAKQQYDAAVQLLQAGDYAGAESGLKLFLELHPDDPLASNAAYWLGESYYVRKNYAAAAAAFARNYQTYGKTAGKAPDNLLKLGMSLTALGEDDKACVSYSQLRQAFPDVPTHIEQAVARERERAGCQG